MSRLEKGSVPVAPASAVVLLEPRHSCSHYFSLFMRRRRRVYDRRSGNLVEQEVQHQSVAVEAWQRVDEMRGHFWCGDSEAANEPGPDGMPRSRSSGTDRAKAWSHQRRRSERLKLLRCPARAACARADLARLRLLPSGAVRDTRRSRFFPPQVGQSGVSEELTSNSNSLSHPAQW